MAGVDVSDAVLTSYGTGPAPVVVGNGEGFGIVTASGGAIIDGIKVQLHLFGNQTDLARMKRGTKRFVLNALRAD